MKAAGGRGFHPIASGTHDPESGVRFSDKDHAREKGGETPTDAYPTVPHHTDATAR
jgi:hypothetical protein